jgi:hypothetical protein
MTAYTYTRNVPQAAQTIAATQPIINNNFQFMQDWAQSDHAFIAANSSSDINGWHNKVTFPNTSAPPAFVGGVGAMYTDTRDAATVLAFVNSGGSFAMFGRNPSDIQNGESSLPGPIYVKWGITNAVTRQVTFTTPFPNNRFAVIVTPILDGHSLNLSESTSVYVSTNDLPLAAVDPKAKFSFSVYKPDPLYFGIYWLAIGN